MRCGLSGVPLLVVLGKWFGDVERRLEGRMELIEGLGGFGRGSLWGKGVYGVHGTWGTHGNHGTREHRGTEGRRGRWGGGGLNFFCVVGFGAVGTGHLRGFRGGGWLRNLRAGIGGLGGFFSGGRKGVARGGVEPVGGVFEVFERLAETFEGLADVRGGGEGEFAGVAEDGLFESVAESEMDLELPEADGEEGVFGQFAVREMLLERGGEAGGGLAFSLGHPGRGLSKVFEVHGRSPVMCVPIYRHQVLHFL